MHRRRTIRPNSSSLCKGDKEKGTGDRGQGTGPVIVDSATLGVRSSED
jgi:hypothetical protein